MGTFRYKAFISYSHRDREWSAWLQRAIERYRIPKRLVGTEGVFGPIPRRLTPVFRDREDLPSASDLSNQVKQSLESSESLIVVCSPASAQSRWVDEEIRYFRSLGRGDRIFALIVDGDPQSDDPAVRCFPAELTRDADGTPREPLAADVRKWADGKLLAKLKVIAGIIGVRLDGLRRRDMQRRHRLWMASAGAAVAIALVMSVLAVMAITARNAAENRREHAEELVGYMVGDLKSKLDEVGRLDILEGMGGRVSDYLATLDSTELTDESLIQQARVWRQLGEVGFEQGNLGEALRAFGISRDILAELYRRDPENTEFLYELGNAEFWVGYAHNEAGEFDLAEQRLSAYLQYADELVALEPDNAEWLMEKSYAHSNLAALINERGGGDYESAIAHIKLAVELNRQVMEMDPENASYQSELGTALAWLADTQLLVCDLGDALVSRQESVGIARNKAAAAPGNAEFKLNYAWALTGVGSVAFQVGLTGLALESFDQSKDILGQLSMIEPTNVDYRFGYLSRESFAAEAQAEEGNLQDALVRMEAIRKPMEQVLEAETYGNLRRYLEWIDFLLAWSDMKWRAGDAKGAFALMDEAVDHLGRLMARENDDSAFENQLLGARFQYWQQRGDDLFDGETFGGVRVPDRRQDLSCDARANAVRQAIIEGDNEKAREIAGGLLARGYYEPRFIRTCREYGICQ